MITVACCHEIYVDQTVSQKPQSCWLFNDPNLRQFKTEKRGTTP